MTTPGAGSFWRADLAGFAAPTPLWLDRAPARAVARGRPRRSARLTGSSTLAIEHFCTRNEIDIATVAAGAWALLLALYSREKDVLFGLVESPDRSQVRPERIVVDWDRDAATWLQTCAEASRRRAAAGPVALDDAHGWSDVAEGLPLFESVLSFGKPSSDTESWPLVVGVRPGRRVHLWVNADADRFDEWTLARLLEHFDRVLGGLVADPPVALGDISLLDEAERQRLLVDWNRTSVEHRPEATIPGLFAEQVAARPDAVAVVCEDRTLSYAELDARSSRLAWRLQALGVKPDTVVGLCLERSEEVPVVLLGILKAGGAYLALDASHPPDRLRLMLEDSGAPLFVTERSLAGHVGETAARAVVLEDIAGTLAREEPSPPRSKVTERNLAYVAYTSGSTGTPKGAEIPHRAVNRLVCAVDYVSLGPDVAVLHAAPLAFDASTFEIWAPLLNGGRCVIYRDPVPTAAGLKAVIERHGVHTLWLTSSLFNAVIEEDPSCLRGVRQLLTGGEALSVTHVRRALDALPETQLFNGYGPTECTTFTTVHAIQRPLDEGQSSIPIGRPIRDTTLYVLDGNGRPVPTGVAGELYVGGAGLARGYLGRPELTAEKFVSRPLGGGDERLYRTGDLVRWRPDGALDFVGRVDAQVKIRGFRIEPGEIQAAIAAHPAVNGVFVLAREDRPGVKRLVAYLVPHVGLDAVGPGALREFLAPALPEFMVPSAFVWLERLPVNANGKVDVRSLPAPAAERPDLDVEFVAARRPVEKSLVALFERILDIGGVGTRDNFFELGGNSLLALKLLAQVRQDFGVDVPAVGFFQRPTVLGLAAAVERPSDDNTPTGSRSTTRARTPGSDLDDVAIIGMGGRFPGAASVAELWRNLCEGVESITYFGDGELDPSLPSAVVDDPSYVRARGILQNVEMFDAAFFGIPPKEAEVMDPQHRLFLEVAWEVLEEAGYVSEGSRDRVGVFGGMYNPTYFQKHVSTRPDLVAKVGEFQVMVANEKDYITTRVAHRLNLTGPAVSVHTACSTSLVAVVQAFHGLRTHQCELALAGGASVVCPPRSGYLYQEGAMLSPDGHTRTFDAEARGTVFSDGVSMLLLKRLKDAVADGDTIYGVIKGAAVNNDGGGKASFTAPSVDGQVAVIRAAHEVAGVDPRSITYVETHGTATPLGDPIEIEALVQAFGGRSVDRQYCALGSVKSNLGHTVIAAGGAGLIKTALALTHRRIPPSLFFDRPNPKIDFASSPFFVNSRLAEWSDGDSPRRAGVSAFGVGGTNAHVVVEEPPAALPSGPSRPRKLLLLSARTSSALDATASRLRDHLAEHPDLDLADVAYTLMVGRRAFAHRRAVVAADVAEAVVLLGGGDPLRVFTRKVEAAEPEVAFLFPGQGAQYVGMGATLYRDEPTYRAMVDYCAEILEPILGLDLRRIVFATDPDSAEAAEALRRTEITQPALFVTEYALAQLWMSWGVQPRAMIGHSVGEFVAAVLAGVMGLDDGLHLVATRGRLMASQPTGAMLSVRLDADDVAGRLGPGLTIASDNAPGLCVVAGPHEEIARFEAALVAEDVVCRALHTSHAFHSAMMDEAVGPFAEHVRVVSLDEPRIPFVSTVTGTWIRREEALSPEYWARHLRETVRFREGVATLLEDPGLAFLEVGPRATLATLVRRQTKDRTRLIISSLADTAEKETEWTALLLAAGQLWLGDVRLDPRSFHVHESRRRVPLPTYPFERKRFWIEAPVAARISVPSAPPTPSRSIPPSPEASPTEASPRATTPVPFPEWAPGPSVPSSINPGTTGPSPSVPANNPVASLPAGDAPTTGAAQMSSSSPSVRAHLVGQLGDLFEEVSGIEFGDGDAEVTFMELGLDSLALTQIAQQVKKAFKVEVTFRQLMETHPNLTTLAAHLEENMPKELLPDSAPAAPEPPTASPAGVPAAASPAGPPPAAPPGWPPSGAQWPVPPMGALPPMTPWGFDPQSMWMMMQWYQQQQMALWASTQGPATPPVPAASPHPPAVPPVARAAAANTPASPAATSPAPDANDTSATSDEPSGGQIKYEAKKAFGAQTRISTSSDELTPKQRARLEAFTRRYNARTKGSKAYAQRYRSVVADPRTATGFKPAFKELVYPIVAKRSKGAYLWDVDDNRYIDVISGFGSNYFGWQPDFVDDAVRQQMDEALAIGPQTPLLGEVAELFCEMTGNERVAFCNTGSEAVMGCVRLARTATGRSTIAMFTGAYHGIFDEVIVRATRKGKAYPAAPGILPNTAQNVLILDYGTPESLEILRSRADELAAVLVEPVQSRQPDLQPREFLHELRKITAESGTALIFDEVITGFRTGPRGAQGYFGIDADLASYGKVVGGGHPLGVIAGKARFMDGLDGGGWQFGDDSSPTADVTYFAGTFVRHPLALAAAKAVLLYLKKEGPGLQERLNARTAELASTLNRELESLEAPLRVKHFSTLWKPSWVEEQPHGDLMAFMLRDRGIHFYEGFPCFVTTAHSDADLQAVVTAFRESVLEMQEAGFLPEPTPRTVELDASQPPVEGARLGRDPNGDPAWYVPHPEKPGAYVKVN